MSLEPDKSEKSPIPDYNQPLKKLVRQRLLRHAVEALTIKRQQSAVVSDTQFFSMLEYCRNFIRKHTNTRVDIQATVEPAARQWHQLQQSRIGKKEPGELQVLYLCGPNPLNDLKVFVELGIAPYNVWAVESEAELFEIARQELLESELGRGVKLHLGSLHQFFKIVPQQFDLIYFDGCGPLFKGKPNTSLVIRELFINQRLAPLSALITNFTAAELEDKGRFGANWPRRLAAWYGAWYLDPPNTGDSGQLEERMLDEALTERYYAHIATHFDEFYSDFISRFIIEFTSSLLPWWRSVGLPAARKEYFAPEPELKAAIAASLSNPPLEPQHKGLPLSELFKDVGHAQLAKEAYPHLWTAHLSSEILPDNDPFRDFYNKEQIEGIKLAEAIKAVSLVNNFYESEIEWAKHNRQACSPALANLLKTFKWFDSSGERWFKMFCDIPMPNLMVDLLMGLYGYPYHTNINSLLRLSYTAKTRPMYADVFVFDQARYLYDLVSPLSLFKPELSFGEQLVLRICMDAINRHSYYGYPKIFRGAALACIGEEGFGVFKWPARQNVVL
jgi:hypothetical protein